MILFHKKEPQTGAVVEYLSTFTKTCQTNYAIICLFLTKIRKLLLLVLQGKMVRILSYVVANKSPNGGSENWSLFIQYPIMEKSTLEKKISCMLGNFNMIIMSWCY